jgi:hypothetical protein
MASEIATQIVNDDESQKHLRRPWNARQIKDWEQGRAGQSACGPIW